MDVVDKTVVVFNKDDNVDITDQIDVIQQTIEIMELNRKELLVIKIEILEVQNLFEVVDSNILDMGHGTASDDVNNKVQLIWILEEVI